MTHILKLALCLMLSIGFFSGVQAQPPVTVDSTTNMMKNNNKWSNTTLTDTFPRADQQTALMADQLKLSPSQRTRINDIHMRYSDQSHKMLDSLGRANNLPASRDKMTMLRKQQDAEIKNVLTIEQWNNWEKYQTEQNKKMNSTNPNDPANMNRPNPNDPTNMNRNNPNDPTNMNRPNPNDPAKPNKQKDDKTKMNNPSSPQPSQTAPPKGNGN